MSDQGEMFKSMLEGTPAAVSDQETKLPLTGESDEVKNLLTEITNERGEPKYQTVTDAVKALKASQEHISTLEKENQEYKEQVKGEATVTEILEQLNSAKNKTDDSQDKISLEDVQNIVSKTLESTETAKIAQKNQSAVVSTLVSLYGDKAEEKYNAKAVELGLTEQELNTLASRSPKAVLQYFDATIAKETNKPIQGTVNTEGFQQHTTKPQEPKPVMYGASSSELVSAWKAHAVTET